MGLLSLGKMLLPIIFETFEVGLSGQSTPTFDVVGFQDGDKIDSQLHKNSVFDRLPISICVCKRDSEKDPNDRINTDYDRDNYHQA